MAHTHAAAAEERLANNPASELWGEHTSRYHFASTRIAGLQVLDLACGAGFGLRMLRSAGALTTGVDIDPDSVAQTRALDPTARVVRASGLELPFPDQTFDAVTSFETVEHMLEAGRFVNELARVITPLGFALVSTPNKDFGPPDLHKNNPFHVREFTARELAQLLEQRFSRVTILGQRPSSHYRYVPFLMWRPTGELSEVSWKMLNRLPYRLKNALSRAISQGRCFYPGERDYRFDTEGVADSHDLLAVAECPIQLQQS